MPRSFLKNLSLLLTLNFVSADLSFAVDHPQLSGKSHAFMTEEALALFPIASVHRFKDPSSRLINDQLKGGNWSASDHGVAFFAVFIGSEIFAELARHGSTFAGSAAVGLFSFWGLPIAAAALAGIWVNHQNRVSAPSWLSRSGFSSLRDWRALQDWKKVATSSEAMGTIERWALRQNFRPERIFLSTSLPSGVLARTTGHGETATIEIAWTLVVRSSRYSGLRRVVLAWVLAHEARRLQTNASTISVYLQKNALSLILDTWMALSEPRRAYADTIHTAMTVLQQAIDRHQVDPYDPKLLRQIRELGVTHQDELLRRGIIHQLVEQFSKAQTSEWASDIARTLQWFATNKARLAILRSYAAGSPLRWSFIPRKKDVENLAITAKLLGWNEKNGKQDVVLSAA